MIRSALFGALLAAIGAVAASLALSWRTAPDPSPVRDGAAVSALSAARPAVSEGRRPPRGFGVARDRPRSALEQRVRELESRVAEEAAERQRLRERVDTLSARLSDLGGGSSGTSTAGAIPPSEAAQPPADDAPGAAAVAPPKSAMERALTAAGLDPESAEDIKRRNDDVTMQEMELRDRATREQWLDTPRFAEEMTALEAQKPSIRDEIGDDAYDRYLYAMGRPNRVRVDDVMLESPAEQAGLQSGDMIVRYGDARVFAPGELVAETRSGTLGETVRLEVIRNGERLEIDVPRGPLGVRIAATQDTPGAS
jgi:hypothetical protein